MYKPLPLHYKKKMYVAIVANPNEARNGDFVGFRAMWAKSSDNFTAWEVLSLARLHAVLQGSHEQDTDGNGL